MSLAIRSLTLSIIAAFSVWYAFLDGRALLQEALPEISDLAPATSGTLRIDSPADVMIWLAAFALPIVAVVVLIAMRRSGHTRVRAMRRLSSADEQLWAEHLAWLESNARAHLLDRVKRILLDDVEREPSALSSSVRGSTSVTGSGRRVIGSHRAAHP